MFDSILVAIAITSSSNIVAIPITVPIYPKSIIVGKGQLLQPMICEGDERSGYFMLNEEAFTGTASKIKVSCGDGDGLIYTKAID